MYACTTTEILQMHVHRESPYSKCALGAKCKPGWGKATFYQQNTIWNNQNVPRV